MLSVLQYVLFDSYWQDGMLTGQYSIHEVTPHHMLSHPQEHACATFNFLSSERRITAAGLIPPPPPANPELV